MQNASEEMPSIVLVLPKLFSLLKVNICRGFTTIEGELAIPPKLLILAQKLHLFLVKKKKKH